MARKRPDPAVWEREDMLAALAARDIAQVYRLVQRVGLSQRAIAALTGQSQSEVSEILAGRQVVSYDVLVRIADGLGVPRGQLGLSYGESPAGVATPSLPAQDPGSGRWVVHVPVLVDTYDAGMQLLDSVGSSPAAVARSDTRRDEGAAGRGWLVAAREALAGVGCPQPWVGAFRPL